MELIQSFVGSANQILPLFIKNLLFNAYLGAKQRNKAAGNIQIIKDFLFRIHLWVEERSFQKLKKFGFHSKQNNSTFISASGTLSPRALYDSPLVLSLQ